MLQVRPVMSLDLQKGYSCAFFLSGTGAYLSPFVLRISDSDGGRLQIDSAKGISKLTVKTLISRLRRSMDRLGLEVLLYKRSLNGLLHHRNGNSPGSRSKQHACAESLNGRPHQVHVLRSRSSARSVHRLQYPHVSDWLMHGMRHVHTP